MNSMDVRVIGASALTAAAVSVITVVGVLGLRRESCPAPPTPVVLTAPAAAVAPPRDPDEAYEELAAQADEVDDEAVDDAVDDSAAEPLSDDPCEAAKEKGMQNINMGQHAAALAQFEASLRCKDDPYVRQLAFMESCASGNSAKAKLYYKKLTPPQQTKFAQICIRQNPPVAYE